MRPISGPDAIHPLPLPKGVNVGHKFKNLTVLERVSNDAAKRVRLRCKCDCGGESVARLSDLRSGHTTTCGCLRAKTSRRKSPRSFQRYGNLNALGPVGGGYRFEHWENEKAIYERLRASKRWAAKCVFCPQVVFTSAPDLLSGKRRCSCLAETYTSWRNMIQRCTNKNHDQYRDYGDRGIVVCDEWLRSSDRFIRDMGRRPKGKTLDRRDPNGPYNRANCRWADAESQARNRRPRSVRKLGG